MSQFPLPRILEFIRKVAPFDQLEPADLDRVVRSMEVAYFPRGELVIKAGQERARFLFVIQCGSVKISLTDENGEEILVDVRGEGDTFGSLSLLEERKALLDVTVQEDLIAFLVPGELVKELVRNHPAFLRHFSFSLARRFRTARQAADCHLSALTGAPALTGLAGHLRQRVTELMSAQVTTCPPQTSIRQAAGLMTERGVGSLVVVQDGDLAVGIITDTDIRARVVAPGLDIDLPVERVMSGPILTVPNRAFAFEALLEMTLHGVHHLVVVDQDNMVGIISDQDLKDLTGASPVGLVREIDRARDQEKLRRLLERTGSVMDMLLRMGSSARFMMAVASELTDRAVLRVLALARDEMAGRGEGGPPVEFSWLAVGSAGRKEQGPAQIREHALAFSDPPAREEAAVRAWFLAYAERVEKGLAVCGLPTSRSLRAGDPRFCRGVESWLGAFGTWVAGDSELDPRRLASLLDMRPLEGETNFIMRLRQLVFQAVAEDPDFLGRLARATLGAPPPLGFLRGHVVERDNQFNDLLDLRKAVLTPITAGIRVLALKRQICETSTLGRIAELEKDGILGPRRAADLEEAFSFAVSMLISRLVEGEQAPGDAAFVLSPASLNSTQRKMFKDCFQVVGSLQEMVCRRFGVEHA